MARPKPSVLLDYPNPSKSDCATVATRMSNKSMSITSCFQHHEPFEHHSTSEMSVCTYPLSHTSSEIRSRYLFRLGVDNPFHALQLPKPTQTKPTHGIPSRPSAATFADRLRIGVGKDDVAVSSDLVRPERREGARQSIVSFHPSVIVHQVPSRWSWSARVRKTIWPSRIEFAKNMTRNSLEYLSEGCNPDNVLEEKDFVWSGHAFVHPVYLTDEYELVMGTYRDDDDDDASSNNNNHPPQSLK